MTDRYYMLAKANYVNITNKKYNDNQPVAAEFVNTGPIMLKITNWQNIGALDKVDIAAFANASDFQFDHDE